MDRKKPSRWSTCCAQVAAFVRKEGLFFTGDRVLVGVSGGIDSVFLWEVLCALGETLGIEEIIAVYVDHGLRPDQTQAEAAWVRALAARSGRMAIAAALELSVQGASLQERAREARLACLERLATEHHCTRIALGHHRDDQAETLLQRFLRGTGPRGLAGIWPIRDRWVRPLLCLSRSEIQAVFDEQSWTWCEDPTNLKTDYQRNQIRHLLLPLLEHTYNPQLRTHLAHLAWRTRQDEVFFAEQIESLWKAPLCVASGGILCLSLASLRPLAPSLLWRCLQRAIWEVYEATLPEEQIEHLALIVAGQHEAKKASLPAPFCVIRTFASLWFLPPHAFPSQDETTQRIEISKMSIPSQVRTPWGGLFLSDASEPFCGALPHTPQGSAAPLTPYWRNEQRFFHPTALPLEASRTRDLSLPHESSPCKQQASSERLQADSQPKQVDCEGWSVLIPRLEFGDRGACLRTRRVGDIVRLKAGHRSLKRWLVDQHVPVFLRDIWPVLAYEQSVVWLPSIAQPLETESQPCLRLTLQPAPWLVSLQHLFFAEEERQIVEFCWPSLSDVRPKML
ncbi:tRNA lysidine(34) synthetase TilS [Myxococcota bacterium]|nr:tRNA lysidine(34) synthetase TilS [Myxococcota bacterium]